MFSNAIRTQARLALASCRTRVALTSVARPLAPRQSMQPMQSMASLSRSLSTARVLLYDSESRAPVRAKNPPSQTVFIGNLPFNVEEAEVREKFEAYGPIQALRVAYRPDGSARGFAHVEYKSLDSAVKAFESASEEPIYIGDRDARVDFAPPRAEIVKEPFHKLYFYDFRGDEAALREAVQEFDSSIVSTYFLTNTNTGERTGTGFIDFMDVERATQALEQLNGKSLGPGAALKLSYARPPRPRTPEGDRAAQRSSYGGDWGGPRRGGDRGGRGGYGGDRRGGRDDGGSRRGQDY